MEQTKRCTKCGEAYPLTSEHWHRDKNKSDGFHSYCKMCACERRRQYSKVNADKVRESRRKYYESNADKVRERNHRYYEANADKLRESKRQYRESNADKERKRQRKYYEANADKILERQRQYYEANAEKVLEYQRQYRETNPDKLRERQRRYYKTNPDKAKVKTHRRHARKRDLPDTMTAQDWRYALDYFNGCCAVCGRQLNDLFGEHTAAMDHWIPLASPDCPGTIPSNVVPLCHGVSSCNLSKGAKDAQAWLVETYGTRKGKQIMARIEAYFASLDDRDSAA